MPDTDATASQAPFRTRKKPSYPVSGPLRDYLRRFRRERELPVTYERLRHFRETIPLTGADGKPTLWDSAVYDSADMASLNATSEMSASSRSRGRAVQNARAVSYDEDGRYATENASDGAAEARSILSGRGLY